MTWMSKELQERIAAFEKRLAADNLEKNPHDHEIITTNLKGDHVTPTTKTHHDHEAAKRLSQATWHQIDVDPTLKLAQSWGVHRESLYPALIEVGYPAVVKAIELVKTIPGIRCPGKYMTFSLQNLRKTKSKPSHTIVYNY